jgi:hypothetical protein
MYLRLATGDLREVALAVPGARTGKELEKRAELLKRNADWRPVPHSNLFSAAPDLLISQ